MVDSIYENYYEVHIPYNMILCTANISNSDIRGLQNQSGAYIFLSSQTEKKYFSGAVIRMWTQPDGDETPIS